MPVEQYREFLRKTADALFLVYEDEFQAADAAQGYEAETLPVVVWSQDSRPDEVLPNRMARMFFRLEHGMALKPCPFCGGEAELERFGTSRWSAIVSCTDCGCRLESGDEGTDSGRTWNTRVCEGDTQ